jgi:hypothetical protein
VGEGTVEKLPGTHSPCQEQGDEEMHAASEDDLAQEQPSASHLTEEVGSACCTFILETPMSETPLVCKTLAMDSGWSES